MKKCPFCAEEIQDEAIVCRYCGRDLPATKTMMPESAVIEKKDEKKRSENIIYGCLIAVITIIVILVAVWILSVRREVRDDESRRKQTMENIRRAEEATIARREAFIKEMPQLYEKAVVLSKAGKDAEALPLFERISQVDPNYKDVSSRLKSARDKVTAPKVSELLKSAARLDKSDACSDMTRAAENYAEVLRLNPNKEREVTPLLQKARERMLSCYQGVGPLQMAISIRKRRPVTLFVWIKNASDSERHANPNYFTLVTKSGESHSYSSDSFQYTKPFPSVQLQPKTEASGIVVFDTYDAPKTLIYQELLGARVARDFP